MPRVGVPASMDKAMAAPDKWRHSAELSRRHHPPLPYLRAEVVPSLPPEQTQAGFDDVFVIHNAASAPDFLQCRLDPEAGPMRSG